MLKIASKIKEQAIFALFIALLLTGCSSGGGDSAPSPPPVQPLTYVGNQDLATITLANAPALLVSVLDGGNTATNLPTGVSVSTTSNAAAISNSLVTLLDYSMDSFIGDSSSGYNIPKGIDINQTTNCDTGYFTLVGAIDDSTGAGTVAVNYVGCMINGTTYNGGGTITFNYIDINTGNTSSTIYFALLTVNGPDLNGSMSGTMYLDEIFSGYTGSQYQYYTETLQLDIVASDNLLNKMFKFDGYTLTLNIDASSPGYSVNYAGYIYDSIYGGILIENNSALTFSSMLFLYPDGGGPLTMTGTNSRMQLTVESGKHVLLELDLDGDGTYEVIRYVLWSEIADFTNLVLADTDGDGMHDSWETQNGLDPTIDDAVDDPDGDGFSNLDEYQGGSDPQVQSSTPANP